jgi:hypothetical protein
VRHYCVTTKLRTFLWEADRKSSFTRSEAENSFTRPEAEKHAQKECSSDIGAGLPCVIAELRKIIGEGVSQSVNLPHNFAKTSGSFE